jgi:hypothetical protein
MERDKRFVQVGVNSAGDRVYARQGGREGGASAASEDLNDLTKDELQARLKHMGLPVSGNKEELVARLEEAL